MKSCKIVSATKGPQTNLRLSTKKKKKKEKHLTLLEIGADRSLYYLPGHPSIHPLSGTKAGAVANQKLPGELSLRIQVN